MTGFDVLAADVALVVGQASTMPRVALILGSGWNDLGSLIEQSIAIPYAELDGFPGVKPVAGHEGQLISGQISGVPCLVFKGRVHQYQGVSALDAAYPVRLSAAVGCGTLIVTNAAGSVGDSMTPGDIMLISDHINLTGTNPLTGWSASGDGTPFVSMRDAYDPELRVLACKRAAELGIVLKKGVYAGLPGPSYETPAEVVMLRMLGADVVGMSTIPEVIAARALGMRVLGFSLVTNMAAGESLSHAEVLEVGNLAQEALTSLLLAVSRRL